VISKLFSGETFVSETGGAVRTYRMDESLIEVLGQASSIRVHAYVYEKTDATARAVVKFYESSVDGSVDGLGALIGSAIDVSTTKETFGDVSATFCGRVMAILEIDDSAATNQEKFHLVIGVTLILD